MKLKDLDRLKKYMAMTTSSNDNEALMAMRQANQLLAAYKLTWADIFARTVKVVHEYDPGDGTDQDKARIDNAFSLLENGKHWTDFVASLYDQWQRRGSLSDKQKEALFRIAGEEQ